MAALNYGVVEAGSGHLGHVTWAAYGPPTSPRTPVVLLHGLADSSACWPSVVEHLATDRLTIVTDLRGHGESLLPDALFTIKAAADDLAVVVRQVAQRPALVVGHSLGGLVAQDLAVRAPALLRGLVLEDPAWDIGRDRDAEVGAWVRTLRQSSYAQLVRQCLTENPDWPADEVAPWAESKLQVDPRVVDLAQGWGDGDRVGELAHLAPQDEFRTTVVLGTPEHGSVVPAEMAERAELTIEGKGEVLVVEGAGHCVRRDRRAQFLAILDEALAAADAR